jgi:hypothetical protein
MGVPSLAAVRAALDAPAQVREQYRPEDIQAFGYGSAAGQLPPRVSSLGPGAGLAGLAESAESPSGAYDFEFGRPYNATLRHLTGADYDLREFNHLERLELLRRAHQAWERNPYAKAGVRLIRNFTVRTGHTVTTKAKRVREVIDAFRRDPLNRLQQYDKELCDQLLLDGEVFLRFNDPPRTRPARLAPRMSAPPATAPVDSSGVKRSRDGGDDDEQDEQDGAPISNRVVIDPIPPWWVEDFVLDPDFRVIVRAYKVRFRRGGSMEQQGISQEVEEVPADRVLHVAINKLGYELRGRTELLPILPWLKAYKDFLEDRIRINRLKGAMLYDVSIKGSQPGTIAAKRAQYRTPPPPNSVVIHSDAETWQTVDPKINADNVAEDGRQTKLAIAVGFGLPEYALGDGENANRATSSSQQLPMLANFADYQDTLGHFWHEVYEFVIDGAIEAGIIEPFEEEIDSNGDPVLDPQTGEVRLVDVHEAFGVEYPPPDEGDPKNLAEALQTLAQNGWIDDESAIQETGRDPVVIQARLRAQEAAEMDRVAQGLAFPPDGMGGPDLWGLDPETGAPLPPGKGPAAQALALQQQTQNQNQQQPGRGGSNGNRGNGTGTGRQGQGAGSGRQAGRGGAAAAGSGGRSGGSGSTARRGGGSARRESVSGDGDAGAAGEARTGGGGGEGSSSGSSGVILPTGVHAIALRAEGARDDN